MLDIVYESNLQRHLRYTYVMCTWTHRAHPCRHIYMYRDTDREREREYPEQQKW